MQSKANNYLALYNKAIIQTDIDRNRSNTAKYNNLSTIFWGASAVVWAIDLLSVSSKKPTKIISTNSGLGLKYTF